jgi:peptide/nickel transport system permease protein
MGALEITGRILLQFWPVWLGLAAIFALSFRFKTRLGLYGRLMDSGIGKVGLFIVLFWLLTAVLADLVITMSPLDQVAGMKNAAPGTALPGIEGQYYLLGGDNLARDVFSRMVMGSRTVLAIAPAATLFAFMIAFTLGLPSCCSGPDSRPSRRSSLSIWRSLWWWGSGPIPGSPSTPIRSAFLRWMRIC